MHYNEAHNLRYTKKSEISSVAFAVKNSARKVVYKQASRLCTKKLIISSAIFAVKNLVGKIVEINISLTILVGKIVEINRSLKIKMDCSL